MWALRTVGWRASQVCARNLTHLLPQSEEVLMAAQSVARILDAHESSSHLSALNQALFSILQVSNLQAVDRVSLLDRRCHDLVNTVIGRIDEMNAEDFVRLGEWLAKAKALRVGWRDLTYAERDAFHRRLKVHADAQAFTPTQSLSLLSSCSALGMSFKHVTGALEKRLHAPDVQLHMTDIQRLLEVLAKTSKVSPRLLFQVLGKLQTLDVSLMDPKAQVSVYNSLCSLETALLTDQVHRYAEDFASEMMRRVQEFGEADLLEWIDVHARLKYPRLEVTRTLLSELSRRLEKADLLSKTFLFTVLKPLTLIKAHHQQVLPAASLSKLLVEAAKHMPSQYVYPTDFEAAVRLSMQLTHTFPLAFTLAVKRKAQSYTRETFWLPTVLRYCELALADSSFSHSLTSLVHDVNSFPVTDRLTMLNGIYLHDSVSPLEALETVVIASFHTILSEKQLHRTLNLLHRVLTHPNKQLIKKVDFVRTHALEQLFLPWPQDVPKHWVLFLSYFTHRGNEELWQRFIQQAAFSPIDYIHSISLLTAEDHVLEPVLSALEVVAPAASPDNVFFTQRLFDDHTDLRLLERFVKVVNHVDVRTANSAVIARSLDFLLRYVREKHLFLLLPTYLSTLQGLLQQPPADMDQFTKGKLTHLLVACGRVEAAQAVAYVKENFSEKSTAMIAANVAAFVLPDVTAAGLVPDLLRVLNDRRLNENFAVARTKCTLLTHLPGYLPIESSGRQLMKRMSLLQGHLCPLLVDLLASFPCRLLTEQDTFIQSFVHMLMRNSWETLSPRMLVRVLRVLGQQRLEVEQWGDLVSRVMADYRKLSVGAKVELVEVAARWGREFQDVTFRVCKDICAAPLDYLFSTGRILGALSDGNLQHSLPSAQVAEALVFSPRQTFALSADPLAQVLMFCVRIGMEDTQLIRKLLALPPPSAPGNFNLKRYLLHLHYKDKESTHFSLKSELSQFKAALQSTACLHFHSTQHLKVLSDAHPGFTTHTFRNDLYLPVLDDQNNRVLWPVPLLALQRPGQKELLGDYQFYLQLCQAAGVQVEQIHKDS